MSHLTRTCALTAVAVLTTLGLSACDGATQNTAAPKKPAAPALPTGHALAARLLPASAMPAGLRLTAGDSRDTGDKNVVPTSSPFPAAKLCDNLGVTGWVRVAGQGSASWAQNDYSDQQGQMVAQEYDAFTGTTAQTVMAKLRADFTTCATFKTVQSGNTYTEHLTWKPLPGTGDDAIEAVMTSPDFEGGTTLVAVRTGHVVVTTLDNSFKNTGSAAVGYAKALVTRVPAAG